MARLILLNGPPGIGKSTLARRWVDDHPPSQIVEVDEIRTSLDGWQDDETTKMTARHMAVELVDALLRDGHDVIVPQYLGRFGFIEELDRTALAAGADFVEVQLTADPAEIAARFRERRAELVADGGAHPQTDLDDAEIAATIEDAVERLRAIALQRPQTRVVPDGADSYDRLTATLRLPH